MSSYCDGVIVGSAVVDVVAQYGKDAAEKSAELLKSLKSQM